MHNTIFLTGFMGSGKSKIGKVLAKKMNKNFIDTDEVIEKKYNRTIAQLFDKYGEKKFREIEEIIISELIRPNKNAIYALGGGSLISSKNLNLVQKSGLLIYIESEVEEIWKRTKKNTERPLLLSDGKIPTKSEFLTKIKNLMEERLPGYKKAQIVINRDGLEADEVVEEILYKLKN